MKKRFTLMMLAALVAVASFAQPAKRSPEIRMLTAEQVKTEASPSHMTHTFA